MTSHDLLDVIGDAQDAYILSAQRSRTNPSPAPRRRTPARPRRVLLIAAAIAVLLVLTACAAKYVTSLFVTYFAGEYNQELSSDQIDYIERHTQQDIAQPVTTEGIQDCQVSVRSALTDGKIAYITLGITAPGDVSLEESEIRFLENPLLIPATPAPGLVIAPDGSSPDAMRSYFTIDDGDGLANTASVLFEVTPATEDPSLRPFDGSIVWTLQVGGFVKSCQQVRSPLSQGSWEFSLQFEAIDTREIEFVTDPIPMKASVILHNDYTLDCQLTSFVLSGLGFRMTLLNEDPAYDEEWLDVGMAQIVMKDGTATTLLRASRSFGRMKPLGAPILLDEVASIHFQDGTVLYPPA